jgi:hypothetical protein
MVDTLLMHNIGIIGMWLKEPEKGTVSSSGVEVYSRTSKTWRKRWQLHQTSIKEHGKNKMIT